MVVKSATKKRLMDLGFSDDWAHKLADDRKWEDVITLWPSEIKDIVSVFVGETEWEQNQKRDVMLKWLLLNQLDVKFDRNNKGIISLAFEDKEIEYSPQNGSVRFIGNATFRGLGSLFSAPTVFKWFTTSFSQHTGLTPIKLPADIEEWQRDIIVPMFANPTKLYKLLDRMSKMETPVAAQSINRADIIDILFS